MNNSHEENTNKSSFVEKIKANKKLQFVFVIILSIILIFVFISSMSNDNKTEQVVGINEYVTNLETRLENTLSKVNGAGKVSVVITIESGMETVLAMEKITRETASGKEITETPLIVNGKTVVIKENYPKIIGVLIVAKGADNISTLSKIQQATISLLDINVNQIEILTMK